MQTLESRTFSLIPQILIPHGQEHILLKNGSFSENKILEHSSWERFFIQLFSDQFYLFNVSIHLCFIALVLFQTILVRTFQI